MALFFSRYEGALGNGEGSANTLFDSVGRLWISWRRDMAVVSEHFPIGGDCARSEKGRIGHGTVTGLAIAMVNFICIE